MTNTDRFRSFVRDMTILVGEAGYDENRIFADGQPLLKSLVSVDDWLAPEFAASKPGAYNQFLLHCDPLERFCVVSFVWGPGVATPIHDHTVWGMIGMLRGSETSTPYTPNADGTLTIGETGALEPGMVECVSPTIGDVHVVKNAYDDKASISIHVYGGNIGSVHRHTFAADTGAPQAFISGYSNTVCPNIWDRSLEDAS